MDAPREPVSLLLVDDRPENLTALEAMLESPEYHLVKAGSGPEALAALEKESFALVLLDAAMPGMSGFDVADHMQSHERTRHVPILFLTAIDVGLEHIYRAYTIGAVDYLIKPLDFAAVRAKVRVFADLYKQKREADRQAAALREAEQRQRGLRIGEKHQLAHLLETLDGVTGCIGRLREGLATGRDPAALAADVDAIEHAAEAMRRLVGDLQGSEA